MTAPFDPNDIPPDDFPPPAALPGLGGFLVPRHTCNIVVNDEMRVLDFIDDEVFVTSRMFMTQGSNGKIRLHNKKPKDYALGTAAFPVGDTVLDADDVSAWVADNWGFLLIDPHTNDSEIRTVTSAAYPLSQNSTALTTSHTGTAFTLTAFAGADGASTPATGRITVATFTATTTYTVTLDGYAIDFTPTSSDTTETIAAFIAGALRGHPAINRRFLIEWSSGDSFVDLTARYGTLTLDNPLTLPHAAPVGDPPAGGALAAVAASTDLAAGEHRVSYTEANSHGETLLSPYKAVTIVAGDRIDVPGVTPSAGGNTIRWYCSPEADSTKLRFYLENDGSAHSITELPKLDNSLPPDLNRTGTEVMRVAMVFSDRAETRSNTTRSNVLRDSISWLLGNRKKTVNEIRLKYRDAAQDFRLIDLRLRDADHIAKTKKTSHLEINGQGIDNTFQAYRIASSLLAEYRDADFFYQWTATREALLLEEGDVVCITDGGAGVYNLPVWIEEIEFDPSGGGMPRAKFTAFKYASTLFDDSIIDRRVNVVVG